MKYKDIRNKQLAPWGTLLTLRELAETYARDNLARSPEETQKILHERYIHQIELEMQNEELLRVHAELDYEREYYYDLYDLAPVGYCTISDEEMILDANLTISKLLGVVRVELVKQSLPSLICKEDQDIYNIFRRRLHETGKPQTCELRIVKMNETELWAHLTGTVTQGADGALLCRVALTDMTNLKKAEDALKEAKEQAEKANRELSLINATLKKEITERMEIENALIKAKSEADVANQAKSQFLANMSHEIRTPMTSIVGMIDVLLMTNITEEQRKYLTIVKSSNSILVRVLKDILNYSKIEAGKVNLEQVPFDIREIIHEVVDLFHGNAKQKNIYF
ncbi:MAG: histidine kinase dimerization/phospho-acceptor domain-containing protein [Desulfosporosinus sp.]|nr:histidine kinase dimerization/phospho-acceptor domain-containing protein [Desulfosporosinus sp.]